LPELAERVLDLGDVERRRRAIDEGVQRGHELVCVLALAPDGHDRAERVHVGVLEVEHATVVGEGLLVSVELLEEDLRPMVQDFHPPLVRVGDVVFALEDVAELGPLSGRFVEDGQRSQRLRVLAAKIEHPFPGLDGAGRVF
jgi:hypothetical protein